jgi:hypothetical protein
MLPIGVDSEKNNYYYVTINKDCRIYKETEDFGLHLIVRNYDEVEQFIAKFEGSKNSKELNLIKAVREILLTLKENDEEEKKREAIFIRKQQAFDKAKKLNKQSESEKYQNSDYFLMNISDHVITRNQLNQITRISAPCQTQTRRQVSAEDIKKEKVEKERMERERRLEKRSKLLERQVEEEVVKKSIESARRNRLISKKRFRNKSKLLLIRI